MYIEPVPLWEDPIFLILVGGTAIIKGAKLIIASRVFRAYIFSIASTKVGGTVITIGGGLFRYVGTHPPLPGEVIHSRQIELFWRWIVWRF